MNCNDLMSLTALSSHYLFDSIATSGIPMDGTEILHKPTETNQSPIINGVLTADRRDTKRKRKRCVFFYGC